MANKKIGIGMLVMALAFGMAVVGCGGNGSSSNINFLDHIGLSQETPGSLPSFLDNTSYNAIINHVGAANYLGWAIFDGEFFMVWENKTQSDRDSLHSFLYSTHSMTSPDDDHVNFTPTRLSQGGFYVPAGTLWTTFEYQ